MTGPIEESLDELYEHAPCGYLSTTPDGVIVRVNETLVAWTGYSQEELLARSFGDLLETGSQLFYETRYLPVLRLEGEVREVALTLRRADGTRLPILINSLTVAGSDGQLRLVRTAVFDSTERQDYERELLAARRSAESSESRVSVLQDASSAFGATVSEESLAAALAESARAAFSATAAAVMLLDAFGVPRLVAGDHPVDGLLPAEARRPEAEAIERGEIVTVSSVDEAGSSSPVLAEALQSARLEAFSAIPLIEDGVTVGALICFFGRQRRFDDHDLELQAALARQAVQVLGRIRLQRELEQLALYDQLTGLANRKLMQDRMGQALASSARNARAMAVIFLDLDGFKAVNDHLGHTAGDAVLRSVAERLRAEVRQNDIIGRFGGDEFVVICEDADEAAATQIAERIRAAVREPLHGVPESFSITASVGIAVYVSAEGSAATVDGMFGLADTAMYESKNAGKDRVTLVRA